MPLTLFLSLILTPYTFAPEDSLDCLQSFRLVPRRDLKPGAGLEEPGTVLTERWARDGTSITSRWLRPGRPRASDCSLSRALLQI